MIERLLESVILGAELCTGNASDFDPAAHPFVEVPYRN